MLQSRNKKDQRFSDNQVDWHGRVLFTDLSNYTGRLLTPDVEILSLVTDFINDKTTSGFKGRDHWTC